MPQLYSNCCYADMRLDYAKDICPACKEGCGVEEAEALLTEKLGESVEIEN